MNDEHERRALLQSLGGTLQTLSLIQETELDDQTIGELLVKQPILSDVPLLEYVSSRLTAREFTAAALRAFCLWPQRLLDDPLDRAALAASVRDHLFVSNSDGWNAYAATFRSEVPWFGERLPSKRDGLH